MAYTSLLVLALVFPGQATPDWDEVLAIANENQARVSTLRVTWQLVAQDTEGQSEYDLSVATAMRGDAEKQRGRSEESARQILKSADKLEARAQRPKEERTDSRLMDYWTNRRNFQIRAVPNEYKSSASPFPDAFGFPDELNAHFSKIPILSYGPATNYKFRKWNADKVKDVPTGGVMNANTYPASEVLFPPLGAWDTGWPGTRLAIDQWMREPSDTATVLGNKVIDGRSCVVVRRVWGKGKLREEKDCTVIGMGWLDLQRGALPLHLELYRPTRDDLSKVPERISPTDYRKPLPFVVCRGIELKEIAPGVWYPSSGVQEIVGPTKMVTDLAADVKGVPHRTLTWTTSRIEVTREMPEEMFALPFPERTVFVSQPTGDIRVAGDADEYGRKLVQGVLASTDRSNFRWNRWTYGGLCFALCLSLSLWRWRSRRLSD